MSALSFAAHEKDETTFCALRGSFVRKCSSNPGGKKMDGTLLKGYLSGGRGTSVE
jgi:hypothetical protein